MQDHTSMQNMFQEQDGEHFAPYRDEMRKTFTTVFGSVFPKQHRIEKQINDCIVKCCDDELSNKEFESCIDQCRLPLTEFQSFMESKFIGIGDRSDKCMKDCEAKDGPVKTEFRLSECGENCFNDLKNNLLDIVNRMELKFPELNQQSM